jgi:uncharacterized membrane protein YeaQ/YmgE (transglycosylase-associated protein family)
MLGICDSIRGAVHGHGCMESIMIDVIDFAIITFALVTAVLNAVVVLLLMWFIYRSMNNDD